MNNIVQNQDSGITKFEYTVIMTSLFEIFITIFITHLVGINNILVIFVFSLIVITINIMYWIAVKNNYGYIFED